MSFDIKLCGVVIVMGSDTFAGRFVSVTGIRPYIHDRSRSKDV